VQNCAIVDKRGGRYHLMKKNKVTVLTLREIAGKGKALVAPGWRQKRIETENIIIARFSRQTISRF